MNDMQMLLAEREVRNVVLRYCRGIDRMDLGLVRSCYHADAEEHHGQFVGGIDEALAAVWEILGTYGSTVHVVGNLLVEIDPDVPAVARCETYGVAMHFEREDRSGRPGVDIGFRWIDDLVLKRPSPESSPEWRFSRRAAVTEWIRKPGEPGYSPIPERLLRGSRDGTDPLYSPRRPPAEP
jgi:hypothetical protein